MLVQPRKEASMSRGGRARGIFLDGRKLDGRFREVDGREEGIGGVEKSLSL